MNAPFYPSGVLGNDTALLLAVVIGIGFGFFLEQAGLGSSRKLLQQFYFRDFTVFKVMFSAIVTAMLGLFWLSYFDVLHLSRIHLPETYLVPQALGGVLFGTGFVMGGYCPGTCVVASITGRIDGWINLVGMLAGIFIFGEAYPFLEGLLSSTAMGAVTLADTSGLSHGVIVLLVVVGALACFAAAEWLESRQRNSAQ